MTENRYFKEALSGFVTEAAYAGAVRHLHDLGYSVEKIRENLAYPASLEQISRVIEDYEKKKNSPEGEYEFVQVVNAYGRRSFQKVKKTPGEEGTL